ncbi:jg16874 [Pararge aegeria aegeria]|uniref:Jg16874 protein n=1 Tax=Pararge aegeria aegeria TaxID=348720 RepID=A0A8S4SPK4_9NEOP|nr:jg16874 [Pararge aegeria aegeria]
MYQAQVRSCMEYCSHLWDDSAKYQLDALDSVDRRARRLIGDLANKKLKSLEHRRKVACLSVFYRIYFGECAQELFDPRHFYHRTARHRKDLHPYVVVLPRTRTKRFASSFLTRTARIWNALPASIFSSFST